MDREKLWFTFKVPTFLFRSETKVWKITSDTVFSKVTRSIIYPPFPVAQYRNCATTLAQSGELCIEAISSTTRTYSLMANP